eukprot:scaffold56_cov379-Prasinococcus_capsulatus_cf.AAC.14
MMCRSPSPSASTIRVRAMRRMHATVSVAAARASLAQYGVPAAGNFDPFRPQNSGWEIALMRTLHEFAEITTEPLEADMFYLPACLVRLRMPPPRRL